MEDASEFLAQGQADACLKSRTWNYCFSANQKFCFSNRLS